MTDGPNLQHEETFQPLAGLMAVVFPGLGHGVLGDWKRAGLICLGVMGLFLGGMLIGGIDVIDRRDDKWWFVLQAGVGPTAFLTNYVHQKHVRTNGESDPANQSLGRVNEVGSLYAGMAGLLNLIAIIDASWHAPASRRRRDERRSGGGGA